MKTVILFAMMVAVICVQNIEIESVQVCLAPQEFKNVKKKSVEDLCVGTTIETKICGGNKPAVCENQYGECDADGFRAVYWQHMKNEGFSSDFKDACYNDHSKCQFGHNPPLKESNFMNLANLVIFKGQIDIEKYILMLGRITV